MEFSCDFAVYSLEIGICFSDQFSPFWVLWEFLASLFILINCRIVWIFKQVSYVGSPINVTKCFMDFHVAP